MPRLNGFLFFLCIALLVRGIPAFAEHVEWVPPAHHDAQHCMSADACNHDADTPSAAPQSHDHAVSDHGDKVRCQLSCDLSGAPALPAHFLWHPSAIVPAHSPAQPVLALGTAVAPDHPPPII